MVAVLRENATNAVPAAPLRAFEQPGWQTGGGGGGGAAVFYGDPSLSLGPALWQRRDFCPSTGYKNISISNQNQTVNVELLILDLKALVSFRYECDSF